MFPDISHLTETQILAFALVMLRMMAFVFAAPILSASQIPITVRVMLSVLLAVVMYPFAQLPDVTLSIENENIMLLAARELLIGIFLGFLMRMLFFAVTMAGEIISLSMGLASAQLFNPNLGVQTNVVEQFKSAIAILLFFSFNGHHFFIQGMSKSFEMLKIGNIGFNTSSFSQLSVIVGHTIEMALKMSAPVMIAVFVTNLSMGIVGRAVPQINVLMTALTVTVTVGMLVMIISMPLFVNDVTQLMHTMAQQMMTAIRTL